MKYLLFLCCFGCASRKVIVEPMPSNRTSYLFKAKIDSARFLFLKFYNKNVNPKFLLREYAYFGDGHEKIWSNAAKQAFAVVANKYDVWMRLETDSSFVYHSKKGRALPYIMECKAHFSQANDSLIKMEIQVLNSYVIVGESMLPSPPHFVNESIIKAIKPTTVEEYQILQCFGKGLGVFDKMPPLKTN